MSKRNDWTQDEQLALCVAYCIMLDADRLGTKYNKSQIRRELIGTDAMPGPLNARSHGSIEAKLMNISAAAEVLGMDTVTGYKPAPNFQKSLVQNLAIARESTDNARIAERCEVQTA